MTPRFFCGSFSDAHFAALPFVVNALAAVQVMPGTRIVLVTPAARIDVMAAWAQVNQSSRLMPRSPASPLS